MPLDNLNFLIYCFEVILINYCSVFLILFEKHFFLIKLKLLGACKQEIFKMHQPQQNDYCICILTCHPKLNGYLHKLAMANEAQCRFCGEDKTSIHLLSKCSTLIIQEPCHSIYCDLALGSM